MTSSTWLLAGALLIGVTGCSTFEQRYQAALMGPANGRGIDGAWEGSWQSDGGHSGRLRAILTHSSPEVIHARFRATFWKIFESEDEVDLRVTGISPVRAAGEADLGYLKGGVYQYDATIRPDKFEATYKSKYDKGVFNMTPGR